MIFCNQQWGIKMEWNVVCKAVNARPGLARHSRVRGAAGYQGFSLAFGWACIVFLSDILCGFDSYTVGYSFKSRGIMAERTELCLLKTLEADDPKNH